MSRILIEMQPHIANVAVSLFYGKPDEDVKRELLGKSLTDNEIRLCMYAGKRKLKEEGVCVL